MSNWSEQTKKAVTFSYDDGTTQDIRLIELLNRYGLKATFNLNSGRLGKNGWLIRNNERIAHYKVWPEDVRELYAGHEVAAHTLSHTNLTTLDESEIIRQVEQDRLRLSDLAGYEVVGMAYPCGGINNDKRVARIIREHTGVRYYRTITSSYSYDIQENLYQFNPTVSHLQWDKMTELAERFIALEAEMPQIFYIWGHSFEYDYDNSYWTRMEEFCKLISGRKDIFYGTNREVLL